MVEQMLTNATRPALVEAALAKEWGISDRQVRRYIRKVADQWAEIGAQDITNARQVVRQGIMGIIQQAIEKQKLDLALKGYGQLAKIEGLYVETIRIESEKQLNGLLSHLESGLPAATFRQVLDVVQSVGEAPREGVGRKATH